MRPVVENQVARPADEAPLGACPRLTLFAAHPWQHAVFPQCPSEPFETDLPVCGSGPCPRPCAVTQTFPDLPPATKRVSYDERGAWLSTIDVATGAGDGATYDGGKLIAFRVGDTTHPVTYEGGRVVESTDLFDEKLRLGWKAGRVVRLEERMYPTGIEYDAAGRIVKVVKDNDDTQPTTYTYDSGGYVTTVVDGYMERSTYRYDDRHRLVRVESELHGGDASAATAVLTYDGHGRISRITRDDIVDHAYRYTTTYEYCDR